MNGFIQMHMTRLTYKQLSGILSEKGDVLNAFPLSNTYLLVLKGVPKVQNEA